MCFCMAETLFLSQHYHGLGGGEGELNLQFIVAAHMQIQNFYD